MVNERMDLLGLLRKMVADEAAARGVSGRPSAGPAHAPEIITKKSAASRDGGIARMFELLSQFIL